MRAGEAVGTRCRMAILSRASRSAFSRCWGYLFKKNGQREWILVCCSHPVGRELPMVCGEKKIVTDLNMGFQKSRKRNTIKTLQ